jgi:hypothetical protein
MASPHSEHGTDDNEDEGSPMIGSTEGSSSVQSSLKEIRESLERLTRSVGELNSKLRSTGDVLKWVLEALSKRNEEKEVMFLKSIEASNELLSSFMAFVNSRVKPLSGEVSPKSKDDLGKRETPAKETAPAMPKKGEDYLVRPSMVRKLQEEEGKEKDRRSR